MTSIQSAIPSVDRVLRLAAVRTLVGKHGRAATTDMVRLVLDQLRRKLADDGTAVVSVEAIAEQVRRGLEALAAPSLGRVFNLTGTVLHTNLGRALLPKEAVEAMTAVAAEPCNLEYDLANARRGDRDMHLEAVICRLTGAEAATVVNNNAAAVLLVLNSLALRKEVIVSRGELIEIGGSFRMPDIMKRAGCKLREVGTTNRTHFADYEGAVGPRTALIMKVHKSNFEIEGFNAEVAEAALAGLCRAHDMPLVVDLGSGALVDLREFGLPGEPTVAETLANGADLVTFSCDKLLGGPQGGIVAGRADLVARIKRNPIKRAVRVDKTTIAALSAVLHLYSNPERLREGLPTLRLMTRSEDDIAAAAGRLARLLAQHLEGKALIDVVPCQSQIGSGSLPVGLLPSRAIAVRPTIKGRGAGAALERIARAFRSLPIPVVGRMHGGACLFDLRCLDDETAFIEQIAHLDLDRETPR